MMPSPAASAEALSVPINVPPGYEILNELGRGGMGVVYQARQTQLGRLVALKMILHAGHASSEDRARFYLEAEAVARLQHPHIVQIFEVGQAGGLPYLALEFCARGNLDEKLDGTPLPAQEAARLVQTLAQAIEAAHRAQLVHRDLKPGNVLLTADGTPKITDFGLAKKLDVQGQTRSGAVMGTPSYMAPEQAGGNKDIGPAADVYALGAILYELLTGRPPFKAATSLDTIMQVVADDPVPPRHLQSKVPRDLETICLKCLRKEPGKRYATAAALAEDLRRFQANEPIRARPVRRGEWAVKWVKRRPALAALLAVSVVALAAVLGGGTVFTLRLQEQIRETEKARDHARSSQYVAQMNLVQREYEANNIGRVVELLEAQVPREPGTTDYRSFEWNYWHRLSHRELLILQGGGTGLAYSPDGRRLASADRGTTVRVWDAASGQELLALKGHMGPITDMAYSSDGRWLATASNDRTVRIWNAATGQHLLSLQGHTDFVNSVAFSADSRRLVSASNDRTVRVWDAANGQQQLSLSGHKGRVEGVAFCPDGRTLATAGVDKTVRIWDARSGQELRTLQGHTGPVRAVAFDPAGHKLASAGADQTIRIWDAANGKELLAIQENAGPVSGVAYSPDGRRLASAGWDHTVRVWDAASGRQLHSFQGHTGQVKNVAFGSDGRNVASSSSDGTVRLWDAATGQELLTLNGHRGSVWSVAFSPDGRLLASAGDDRVLLWEARPISAEVWHQRGLVSYVRSLFDKLLLRENVVAALRKDGTLSEADREFALQTAQTQDENARALNEAAWKVVKVRDAGKDATALALRHAEAAARAAPDDGLILNTLGVAQYRMGRYADALETLTKSEKLNATKEGSLPADLAFLALVQHQLGTKDEAKATLGRLRKVMKLPRFKTDTKALGFLHEAEEKIEGKK